MPHLPKAPHPNAAAVLFLGWLPYPSCSMFCVCVSALFVSPCACPLIFSHPPCPMLQPALVPPLLAAHVAFASSPPSSALAVCPYFYSMCHAVMSLLPSTLCFLTTASCLVADAVVTPHAAGWLAAPLVSWGMVL